MDSSAGARPEPATPRVRLRCPACHPTGVVDRVARTRTVGYASVVGTPVVYNPAGDPDGSLAADIVAVDAAVILDAATSPPGILDAAVGRLRGVPIDQVIVQVDGAWENAVASRLAGAIELIEAGRIGGLAVTSRSASALRRAAEAGPIASAVVPLSLLQRGAEHRVIPAARSLGARLLVRRPLAGGMLTGAGLAGRSRPTARSSALRDRLARLAEVAAARNVGSTRLALAWLLARFPDADVAPSTLSVAHLEMDLAAERVRLDEGELAGIERLFG